MITKELLSAVLNKHNIEYVQDYVELGHINFEYSDYGSYGGEDSINIHELAHKVKEWAWDNGVRIISYPFYVEIINIKTGEIKEVKYSKEDLHNKNPFLPKYDFKAGEWTLENK